MLFMWFNVNCEILGVGVATMDISQKICFINVFPVIHSIDEFYRNRLSYQPVISVEYWQNYEENTVVK